MDDGLPPPTKPPASGAEELPTSIALPGWTAPVFLGFVVALVPWIAWLALSLPREHTDRNYAVTWVGFDVGLLGALATVMWLAQRRSVYVELAATVAGTMLVMDAWFDTTTASSGGARLAAIAGAVLFELPIAALCGWVARNAEAVRRRTDPLLQGSGAAP